MYYLLTYSLKESVVGCFPQSRTMTDNYNYASDNSVWKFRDEKINFEPNLDGVKLSGKAKITDFIFSAPIGNEVKGNLLVSKSVLEIFQKFKVPVFQKFNTPIYKKNKFEKKLNYFLLHFWTNQNFLVDFEKSKFYLGPRSGDQFRNVKLNSFEEYTDKKAKIESEFEVKKKIYKNKNKRVRIRVDKLILNNEIIEYDLFRINHMGNFFIISENLRNELLINNITGFDCKPIDEHQIKIYKVNPSDEYEIC